MILKKPYAILLKYFRVIHVALTFLLVIFTYKMWQLVSFFNAYIRNNYSAVSTYDLPNTYIPFYIFIIILLIFIVSLAIFILMNHKKKPNKLYLFSFIYYGVLFFGLFYVRSVLNNFEGGMLSSTFVRDVRDILVITYLPQLVFLVLVFIRTIGFDIKKFDFKSDLQELNYSASDAEEFELNINFEGYKAKRQLHRIIRETIYYFKENRFIISIIGIVCAVILIFTFGGKVVNNYDKNYSVGKTFTYNKAQITFEDSIITNLDYNGRIIKDGKYYLVIKTTILNKSNEIVKFDYDAFKLQVGSKVYKPTLSLASHFIDYAPDRINKVFGTNIQKTFALVYEINEKDIDKKMQVQLLNGTVKVDGKEIAKNIYAKVKPKKVTGISLQGNYSLGSVLNFKDTYLGNSTFAINGYSFTNRYIYKYESCNTKCLTLSNAITLPLSADNNTLLIIETAYEQDKSTLYNQTNTTLSSFAENFINIKYRVDGMVYEDVAQNLSPMEINTLLAFVVPKEIENADLIQLQLTIRNKEYIINLKS